VPRKNKNPQIPVAVDEILTEQSLRAWEASQSATDRRFERSTTGCPVGAKRNESPRPGQVLQADAAPLRRLKGIHHDMPRGVAQPGQRLTHMERGNPVRHADLERYRRIDQPDDLREEGAPSASSI
jgi:hypothetical protein